MDTADFIRLIAYYLVFAFYLFVIGRLVVEIVRSFARSWKPAGGVAVSLEIMYRVSDPPVKLLRRIVPRVRLGQVELDLSMMILLIVTFIVLQVLGSLVVRG